MAKVPNLFSCAIRSVALKSLSSVQVLSHTPVDPLIHVSTTEPPNEVFSEALEDPLNDRSVLSTKPEKLATDTKEVEVDLFADPLGESGAKPGPDKNSAPSSNLTKAPPKSSTAKGDATSEVFGASHNNIKKSEDIFEEPPRDSTFKTASKPVGGAVAARKAPSTDLFGDDDDGDDLFEEPLQAAVKKPQAKETSKEPGDQSNNASTDLFTEEVVRVPQPAAATAKSGTESNSKTNGLHSDEDDLFTGTLS